MSLTDAFSGKHLRITALEVFVISFILPPAMIPSRILYTGWERHTHWGYKQITEENSLPRRMTLTWPIFPWQKNPHEAEKVENDHWPQTSMRPHTHAWWSVPLACPWTVYGDRDMGGPRKVHRWENSEKKVETHRKVELSINNRSSNMSRKLKICSSSRH